MDFSSKYSFCEEFKEVHKIEPFWTSGKICALSPQMIACQCGPAVNIVLFGRPPSDDTQPPNEEESTPDKKEFSAPYTILAHYEIELDDILVFDVCRSSMSLVTAHKSGCIRKWNIGAPSKDKGGDSSAMATPASVVKVIGFQTPVQLLEMHNYIPRSGAIAALLFVAIGGAGEISVFASRGGEGLSQTQVQKIDGVQLLSIARWTTSVNFTDLAELVVAHVDIWVLHYWRKKDVLVVHHQLKGHTSQVTGIGEGEEGLISGSVDRTFIIWRREGSHEDMYEKLKMVVLKEPIIAMTPLFFPFLCIVTESGLHALDYVFSTERKPGPKIIELPWHRKEVEKITGVYEGMVSKDKTKEIHVVSHLGFIHRLKFVGKQIESARKATVELQVLEEYVGNLEEILVVKLWEQADGQIRTVVANNSPILTVWNERGEYAPLVGHNDAVLTLATNRERLASGSKDKTIILWGVDNPSPLQILVGHSGAVCALCISAADSQVWSVGQDLDLILWKVEEGKPGLRIQAHEKEIQVVDVSPNSELLVTGSRDKTARLWDARTLQPVATLAGHKKTVWDAKFSKWDERVVTASGDMTVKIWSVESKSCLMTLQGHEGAVQVALFINKGLQILSASVDGHWRVWELVNQTCLASLEIVDEPGHVSLDATADGSLVVAGSHSAVLRRWNDMTKEVKQEKLETAKRLAMESQNLQNLVRSEDWVSVLKHALDLDRPAAALRAIRGIGYAENGKKLNEIVGNLSEEGKAKLEKWASQWRTGKATLWDGYSVAMALELNGHGSKGAYATAGYEERHLARLDKREQSLSLLELMVNNFTAN